MIAMDLVELNPEVDDGSEAAMARAYETIEAALSVVERLRCPMNLMER